MAEAVLSDQEENHDGGYEDPLGYKDSTAQWLNNTDRSQRMEYLKLILNCYTSDELTKAKGMCSRVIRKRNADTSRQKCEPSRMTVEDKMAKNSSYKGTNCQKEAQKKMLPAPESVISPTVTVQGSISVTNPNPAAQLYEPNVTKNSVLGGKLDSLSAAVNDVQSMSMVGLGDVKSELESELSESEPTLHGEARKICSLDSSKFSSLTQLKKGQGAESGDGGCNDGSREVEVEAVSLKKIIDDARSDPGSPWSGLEPSVLNQLNEIYMEISGKDLDVTVIIEKPKFTSYIYEPVTEAEEGEPSRPTKFTAVGTGETKTESLLNSISAAYEKLFCKDT